MAWQARNDDRHGHDAATKQAAAARQAVREIQQLYEMKDEVLPELKYTTEKKIEHLIYGDHNYGDHRAPRPPKGNHWHPEG